MDADVKRFEYLTIAGGTLLLPLFAIVDRLLHVTAPSTAAKANERESAWSLSAISIAAVMLESWIIRAQWEYRRERGGEWDGKALRFYRTLQSEYPAAELPDPTELFVARDLIFHGHLYLVTGQYAPESALVDAQRIQGGDGKFRDAVNSESRTTRALGLNVVPSLITRRDVAKYLRAMVACLKALFAARLLQMDPLSDFEVFGDKGDRRNLEYVVAELEASDVPMV